MSKSHDDLHKTVFGHDELHVLKILFENRNDVSSNSNSLSLLSPTSSLHKNNLLSSTRIRYIIACVKGDKSTLLHEWAHARYFLDLDYKQKCVEEFNKLDSAMRIAVERELLSWNYHKNVIVDEFQAYAVEGPLNVFGKKWMGNLREPQTKLRHLCGPVPSSFS